MTALSAVRSASAYSKSISCWPGGDLVVRRLDLDPERLEVVHHLFADLGTQVLGEVEVAGGVVGQRLDAVRGAPQEEELQLGSRVQDVAELLGLLELPTKHPARIAGERIAVGGEDITDDARRAGGQLAPIGTDARLPGDGRKGRQVRHQEHVRLRNAGEALDAAAVEPLAVLDRLLELVHRYLDRFHLADDVSELQADVAEIAVFGELQSGAQVLVCQFRFSWLMHGARPHWRGRNGRRSPYRAQTRPATGKWARARAHMLCILHNFSARVAPPAGCATRLRGVADRDRPGRARRAGGRAPCCGGPRARAPRERCGRWPVRPPAASLRIDPYRDPRRSRAPCLGDRVSAGAPSQQGTQGDRQCLGPDLVHLRQRCVVEDPDRRAGPNPPLQQPEPVALLAQVTAPVRRTQRRRGERAWPRTARRARGPPDADEARAGHRPPRSPLRAEVAPR